MRSRNIKPGFYRDADLAECSVQARYIVPGLWMLADREGRLKDKPRQIKMDLCPCDPWDVDELLNELEKARHIIRYVAEDGRRVIQIRNFLVHQNPHRHEAESQFPPPPGDGNSPVVVETDPSEDISDRAKSSHDGSLRENGGDVASCRDMSGHVETLHDESRHDDSNPAESCILNPESITNSKNTSCFSSEQADATPRSQPPDQPENGEDQERDPPVITIPLISRDGEFGVTQEDIDQWQETYPGIDVVAELKKARQWNIDNPKRRKTKNGIRRHLSSWLGRAQDRSTRSPPGNAVKCVESRPSCQRLLN